MGQRKEMPGMVAAVAIKAHKNINPREKLIEKYKEVAYRKLLFLLEPPIKMTSESDGLEVGQ